MFRPTKVVHPDVYLRKKRGPECGRNAQAEEDCAKLHQVDVLTVVESGRWRMRPGRSASTAVTLSVAELGGRKSHQVRSLNREAEKAGCVKPSRT